MGLYQSNKGNNLGVNKLREQRSILCTQIKTFGFQEIVNLRNVFNNILIKQIKENYENN